MTDVSYPCIYIPAIAFTFLSPPKYAYICMWMFKCQFHVAGHRRLRLGDLQARLTVGITAGINMSPSSWREWRWWKAWGQSPEPACCYLVGLCYDLNLSSDSTAGQLWLGTGSPTLFKHHGSPKLDTKPWAQPHADTGLSVWISTGFRAWLLWE